MIFGRVHISPHAIERYKERIMSHRHIAENEPNSEISKRIYKEIDLRNTIKTVNFGDKYKFIFTKSNTEFRFEKSRDGKKWIMVTCVRYPRLLASEEPLSINDLDGNTTYGIRTAIKIREKQKNEFEDKFNHEENEGNKLIKE